MKDKPDKNFAAPTSVVEGSDHALSCLNRGEEGVIVDVGGSARVASRFREMGLTPGVRIRLLRAGSPILVQAEDGRLCLRREDAEAIKVRTVNGKAA